MLILTVIIITIVIMREKSTKDRPNIGMNSSEFKLLEQNGIDNTSEIVTPSIIKIWVIKIIIQGS